MHDDTPDTTDTDANLEKIEDFLSNAENIETLFGYEEAANHAAINIVKELLIDELEVLGLDEELGEFDREELQETHTRLSMLAITRFLDYSISDPTALSKLAQSDPEVRQAIHDLIEV
jgi:hypothetical protein